MENRKPCFPNWLVQKSSGQIWLFSKNQIISPQTDKNRRIKPGSQWGRREKIWQNRAANTAERQFPWSSCGLLLRESAPERRQKAVQICPMPKSQSTQRTLNSRFHHHQWLTTWFQNMPKDAACHLVDIQTRHRLHTELPPIFYENWAPKHLLCFCKKVQRLNNYHGVSVPYYLLKEFFNRVW